MKSSMHPMVCTARCLCACMHVFVSVQMSFSSLQCDQNDIKQPTYNRSLLSLLFINCQSLFKKSLTNRFLSETYIPGCWHRQSISTWPLLRHCSAPMIVKACIKCPITHVDSPGNHIMCVLILCVFFRASWSQFPENAVPFAVSTHYAYRNKCCHLPITATHVV